MKVYIRNKFVSVGGSSVVKDEYGNNIYKVKGKVFSPTRVKYLCDANGNRIFKIRNKFINFFTHRAFIYNASGAKIATVRDRWVNLYKEYYIEGLQDDVRTEGKFFSLTCTIYRNAQPVGTIRRRINLVDSFELEAEPKDIPFLIAFVIAIDNIIDNKTKDRD